MFRRCLVTFHRRLSLPSPPSSRSFFPSLPISPLPCTVLSLPSPTSSRSFFPSLPISPLHHFSSSTSGSDEDFLLPGEDWDDGLYQFKPSKSDSEDYSTSHNEDDSFAEDPWADPQADDFETFPVNDEEEEEVRCPPEWPEEFKPPPGSKISHESWMYITGDIEDNLKNRGVFQEQQSEPEEFFEEKNKTNETKKAKEDSKEKNKTKETKKAKEDSKEKNKTKETKKAKEDSKEKK